MDIFDLRDAVEKLKERGHEIGQTIIGPDSRIEVHGKMYSFDDVIPMAKEFPTQSQVTT